jgi:hypothetical protein
MAMPKLEAQPCWVISPQRSSQPIKQAIQNEFESLMNLNVMGTLLSRIVLSLVLSMFGAALATAGELSDALKKSDYVLLMRHALAPGFGDPSGYNLQDCKTQRNLDSKGREQAQRIGQWLKTQGVNQALVFSSAWCRCKETAEKLDFGQPVSMKPP